MKITSSLLRYCINSLMQKMSSMVVLLGFIIVGMGLSTINAQGPGALQFTPVGFPANVETIDILDQPVTRPWKNKEYFYLSKVEPFGFDNKTFGQYLRDRMNLNQPYLVAKLDNGPRNNSSPEYYDALTLHYLLGGKLKGYKGFSLWVYPGPQGPRKLYKVYSNGYASFDENDFSSDAFSEVVSSLRRSSQDFPNEYFKNYAILISSGGQPKDWVTQLILNTYLMYPERLAQMDLPRFIRQILEKDQKFTDKKPWSRNLLKELWGIYSNIPSRAEDGVDKEVLKAEILNMHPDLALDSLASRTVGAMTSAARAAAGGLGATARSLASTVGSYVPGFLGGGSAVVTTPNASSVTISPSIGTSGTGVGIPEKPSTSNAPLVGTTSGQGATSAITDRSTGTPVGKPAAGQQSSLFSAGPVVPTPETKKVQTTQEQAASPGQVTAAIATGTSSELNVSPVVKTEEQGGQAPEAESIPEKQPGLSGLTAPQSVSTVQTLPRGRKVTKQQVGIIRRRMAKEEMASRAKANLSQLSGASTAGQGGALASADSSLSVDQTSAQQNEPLVIEGTPKEGTGNVIGKESNTSLIAQTGLAGGSLASNLPGVTVPAEMKAGITEAFGSPWRIGGYLSKAQSSATDALRYTTATAGDWYNRLYGRLASAYSGLVNRFSGWGTPPGSY